MNPDGSEETNPKNILANIKSFYSELYTSVKTEKEIFDCLYDLNLHKLSHVWSKDLLWEKLAVKKMLERVNFDGQ